MYISVVLYSLIVCIMEMKTVLLRWQEGVFLSTSTWHTVSTAKCVQKNLKR